MTRILLGLLGVIAITTATRAADVTGFELENGMEVVVLEDHRAPVVVHMVWYRVGAADEPSGKSGIAHFLEHLLFKGTDDLASGELSATVNRLGGSDNAFTSWDYTGYFQRVAAEHLELMMQMEADRMRDLEMSEEDVITERQVVLEERGQRVDSDPNALFREQRNAAQYLNHGYGIPVIGWRHELEQLNREDAFAFYRQYYAPNNAILIVAGDVTPDEVRVLAEKHYGSRKANPDLQSRSRSQEPPQLAERRMKFRDARVSQPYVTRSYLAPERDTGDQFEGARLAMLAAVLGGDGATSVLGRKLQFEEQTALFVQASYDGTSLDNSTFNLVIAPRPEVTMEQAEAALDTAIQEFIQEGVDTEQLDRIKQEIRADQIYAEDNIQRLANHYGGALASGLTLEDIKAWPNILQSITETDVIDAAREIFDLTQAVTGWTMPLETEGN